MLSKISILVISTFCFLLVSEAAIVPSGFKDDVYQISKIKYWSGLGNDLAELNNILVDKTSSTDPKQNLDIIRNLVETDSTKKAYDSDSNKAKRILLSLSTLNDENLCTSYGFLALDYNYKVGGRRAKLTEGPNVPRRRVDKILKHYVDRHVKECGDVYFRKFEEISQTMDQTMKRRVETFFEEAIENITSDMYKENEGEYVERLFSRANGDIGSVYKAESEYIWRKLKEVAQDDPDGQFADKVENEKTGEAELRVDKYEKLFNEYLLKPCEYYREQLGSEVFEPVQFDSIVRHDLKKDKPEFYKAWINFKLCKFDRTYSNVFKRTVTYVNESDRPSKNYFPGTFYLTLKE